MTLPSSGQISLGNIEQEINNTNYSQPYTSTIRFSDTIVKTLAGYSSGQLAMSTFHGKTFSFAYTISGGTYNSGVYLSTVLTGAGWNGSQHVIVTVADQSVITNDSTLVAFNIGSDFPNGITIINYGTIAGGGGNGGIGGDPANPNGGNGGNGGTGIYTRSPTLIINHNFISGGAGGGGGGSAASIDPDTSELYGPGGGGGGGALYVYTAAGGGGSGGVGIYSSGSNGENADNGLIGINGGSGGAGGSDNGYTGGTGGAGGSAGHAGFAGQSVGGYSGGAGGAAGNSIDGISYVTIELTGSIVGPTV